MLYTVLTPAWGAAPSIEVFLNGEKPGTAQGSALNRPLSLTFARDEIETVGIRLSEPLSGKLVPLESVVFKIKGPNALAVSMKAYVGAVHHLAKASAKRGSAGEVADILIPNELAKLPTFRVPDSNRPSRPLYFFDLHAFPGATAGSFDAEIKFEYKEHELSIPLRIKIASTQLPKRFDLRSSFGFAPWGALQKHYGAWNAEEMSLYRKYFSAATEHRVDLHKIYVQIPGASAAKSDLLAFGPTQAQTFLGIWEDLASGSITSTGFKWATTDLPVPENMKFPPADATGQEPFKAYWQSLNKSVVRHGLKDDAFVFFIDEPKPTQYAKLAAALKPIREWAPQLRFLSTVPYDKRLDGAFNAWVANLMLWEQPKYPTPEDYRKRQLEKGEKVWLYVGCNSHGCSEPDDLRIPDLVIDRPAAYTLALPVMAVRYQADGVLYFDTVYGYSTGGPEAPWKDPFAFTGYGEGNLFYPCNLKFCGTTDHHVLPALRLKNMRDGMEISQLLLMAKKKGHAVDAWVKELIPSVRKFPLEAAAYEKLKLRALEAMESR